MKENFILTKAVNFSADVIELCQNMSKNYINMVFIDQIARSSSSITANLAESVFASSKKDFAYKLQISLREANESKYWLVLMKRSSSISEADYKKLAAQCEEIIRILAASVKTLKKDL